MLEGDRFSSRDNQCHIHLHLLRVNTTWKPLLSRSGNLWKEFTTAFQICKRRSDRKPIGLRTFIHVEAQRCFVEFFDRSSGFFRFFTQELASSLKRLQLINNHPAAHNQERGQKLKKLAHRD